MEVNKPQGASPDEKRMKRQTCFTYYADEHSVGIDSGQIATFEHRPDMFRVRLLVLEGHGFPLTLKESHVAIRVRERRIVGKKAMHEASNPKWGESFVLDIGAKDDFIELEIKGTDQGSFFSSILHHFLINVNNDFLRRGEIFEHIRERSTRLELTKKTYSPGELLQGCFIYAANRPRVLPEPVVHFRQINKLIEDARRNFVFEEKLKLPHGSVQYPPP